jgi:hypothetical protein
LFKLFKIKNEATDNSELNHHNNKLEEFGLFAFEHRLVARLSTFVHKIVNDPNASVELKALLKPKNAISLEGQTPQSSGSSMQLRRVAQSTLTHELVPISGRHENEMAIPLTAKAAGDATFGSFFAKFINKTCVKDIYQRFSFFQSIIVYNINRLFLEFVQIFPKFNLKNKNFDYLLKKKNTVVV